MKIKIQKNNKKIIKITVYLSILLCFTVYNINKEKKSVYVSTSSPTMLIPSGQAVAMKLKTNGVIVVGTEENMAARKSGIKVGDIIKSVNNKELVLL